MDKIKDSVKKSKDKMVGIFTFSMLFLMFILVILGAIVQKVHYVTVQSGTSSWEASDYYPLEKENKEKKEYSIMEHIFNKVVTVENKIEQKATSSFYFKMPFVFTKKACDKALGLDMTTSLCSGENDLDSATDIVLEYEDSYLGFVMDDVDISAPLEELIIFGSQMKSEGRNFLFFMTPEKFKGNEAYPDHSEEKENEVLDSFEESGLDIVCLSEMMDKSDMAALFFKTDHHWLPSTGIWADGVLCRTLNEKYGYRFDTSVFDMNNYKADILKESFLGSQGKKITEVYCQKEDFPVIVPQYDTNLQVFISKQGETVYGSIEDTLLDYSVFDEEDSYKRNNYFFYGYGDRSLVLIHNNDIHDGSNILIIKTSFADCMYLYLAAVAEDLSIIDLRYFNGSLQSYIRETDPDTVVVIYGVAAFEREYTGKIFDFR